MEIGAKKSVQKRKAGGLPMNEQSFVGAFSPEAEASPWSLEKAFAQTELRRMLGPPFGLDESGEPIEHGTGKLVVSAIKCLEEIVERRTAEVMPPSRDERARRENVEAAKAEAVDRLVVMLNAAIDDPRCHVTREYLMNESHQYSYEFRLFVNEYCRILSGDPDFFFKSGSRSIPLSIARLIKPLGVQRVFDLVPRFTRSEEH